MVPHFLSPLSTCRLRVVDNDSRSEVPTVSCSVIPHLYHPNKVVGPQRCVYSQYMSLVFRAQAAEERAWYCKLWILGDVKVLRPYSWLTLEWW